MALLRWGLGFKVQGSGFGAQGFGPTLSGAW